jgi:uncharacterized membrane protein
MSDEPTEIRGWLRSLRRSLARAPAAEREEIVTEASAHLRDALAKGEAPTQALAGFGAPEEYARRCIAEIELASALASQDGFAMLGVVGRNLHRSAVAASAALVLLVVAAASLVAVAVSIAKLFDPRHAGLWRGAHAFFIGVIDDPSTARELLGYWLFPLAVAVLAIAWVLGRLVLVWAVRSLAAAR